MNYSYKCSLLSGLQALNYEFNFISEYYQVSHKH
jgi:hypothetical protein